MKYRKRKGVPVLIEGTVSCNRGGFGFLLPEATGEDDVFLPPPALKNIYDGDKVTVRITKQRGRKREGEVVSVLARGTARLLVRLVMEKGRLVARPYDSRFLWPLVISGKRGALKADEGAFCIVRITGYPQNGLATGEIEEIIEGDEYVIELKSLLTSAGLPEEYPEKVAREVRTAGITSREKESPLRKDLRKLPFVTIDGEKARDFDDAVCLQKEQDGYRLYVAIADVSHFVRPGTLLDSEAYNRGNSYYFPDRAIPMLPERLANDLCSLRPDEDRLTFAAEIMYDRQGRRRTSDFYLAVIRSRARLTYEKAETVFDGSGTLGPELDPMLFSMRELTLRLQEERNSRGSIDFDLPEPEIVISLSGEIENIIKAKRLFSHRVVEEFMIAANRAVAEWFRMNDLPAIYRVHEKPDPGRLQQLAQFLKNLGYALGQHVTPRDLQKVLMHFRDTEYERLVNTVVLRSMKQARYSSEPRGHFGLALEDYLHFTSPIRRYADLVVHRNLREYLVSKRIPADREQVSAELEEMAGWISNKERSAAELEREIFNFSRVRFMRDKMGEEFDGIISSVTPNGFFVELIEYYVEGFVPVETIGDDYYEFDESHLVLRGRSRRKSLGIGLKVRVRIVKTDVAEKRIDFRLVASGAGR